MLIHGKAIEQQLGRLEWEKIARQTGFQKRQAKKIKGVELLQALCAAGGFGAISLNLLAILMSLVGGRRVSKQGVAKRISEAAIRFVSEILYATLGRLSGAGPVRSQKAFSSFKRVLIQDSTNLSLPKRFSDIFPGSRNQSGSQSAILKIQAVYDLLAEKMVDFSLSGYTRNGQAASPDILQLARAGDLIIRDLGYFALEVFKSLDNRGVFFLSRLRDRVALYDLDGGQRIDLLKALEKSHMLDLEVEAGASQRQRVRLVAMPVSEAVANKRRREAKNNRDKRCKPKKEALKLLGWEIFITNVSREVWSPKTVVQAYFLRWRIEIIFKAWKSHFRLTEISCGSKNMLMVCLLAKLIYISWFHAVFDRIEFYWKSDTGRSLSILKTATFFDLFSSTIIARALMNADEELVQDILATLCSYEKRKQRMDFYRQLAALS